MRLEETKSVRLDASGNGSVGIVVPVGQRWDITRVTVSTASKAAPIPRCALYRSPAPSPAALVGETFTGCMDTDDFSPPEPFTEGDTILAVWTAGNPNDTATMIVRGDRVL